MSLIGVFYGSSTGNTKSVAKRISELLPEHTVRLFDVSSAEADFSGFDLVVFGSSTWGLGDLQEDWGQFIGDVENADLAGKKVALFGAGDSVFYSNTFGDALRHIYDAIKEKGIVLIGETPTEGYLSTHSRSVSQGRFLGLLLDEDNEPEKTECRLLRWLELLKEHI